MSRQQRLIRVLVYEGDSVWIDRVLAERGVKGSRLIPMGGIIREAIIGDFLQVFDTPEQCPDCGRRKAVDAEMVELGDCPKWYAEKDEDAERDCLMHGRGYALPIEVCTTEDGKVLYVRPYDLARLFAVGQTIVENSREWTVVSCGISEDRRIVRTMVK